MRGLAVREVQVPAAIVGAPALDVAAEGHAPARLNRPLRVTDVDVHELGRARRRLVAVRVRRAERPVGEQDGVRGDVEDAAVAGQHVAPLRCHSAARDVHRCHRDALIVRRGHRAVHRDPGVAAEVRAVVVGHGVQHVTDDARVAHPSAQTSVTEDLHVGRVGRVDAAHNRAVERLVVVVRAVPIGDDDAGDAIANDHLHGRAVDRGAPEQLRRVDVADVEHHQTAVRVQVVKAVALEPVQVGLFDRSRGRGRAGIGSGRAG